MFFFFNDTATTEIYTLSLHDALPIYCQRMINQDRNHFAASMVALGDADAMVTGATRNYSTALSDVRHVIDAKPGHRRSEEHTSELQSRQYLVCRLLLEKKKSP